MQTFIFDVSPEDNTPYKNVSWYEITDSSDTIQNYGVPLEIPTPSLEYSDNMLVYFITFDYDDFVYKIKHKSKPLHSSKECDRIATKIFTQINGTLPFKCTSLRKIYNEMGHYPEVIEEMKTIPGIGEFCEDKYNLTIVAYCDNDLKIRVSYVYDNHHNYHTNN